MTCAFDLIRYMLVTHFLWRCWQGSRTFSVGFDVCRIKTAHCISVLGGFSVGITGSVGSREFSLLELDMFN